MQRVLILLALLAVCAFALAACGGGGSSKKRDTTTASAGATGASGASGSTGATSSTGASGASGPARTHRKAGRTKATPSQPGQSGGSGGVSQTPTQPSGGSPKKAGRKRAAKAPSKPPNNFTGQQKELYREAKIVCGALTLDGLAKEYVVKKTPEAVARAYSASYGPDLRGAAYLGCKAAFSKR